MANPFIIEGKQFGALVGMPCIAAIELALTNGVGELVILEESGRVAGRTNLDQIRRRLGDGAYACLTAGELIADLADVKLGVESDADGIVQAIRPDFGLSFIPVADAMLGVTEFRNLLDAFLSGWISSQGEYIRRFETQFSTYCGAGHGVAVSNGTVAIHLALLALGIGPGDEVIVPDLTFAATINTVIMTGATPVIVDVDPRTWCISPETIRPAITDRTRAIIPVHVFGRPAPMTEICELAKLYRLYVIEDCAEAHGARYNGKMVGTFGDISAFSFFANKIITTGEGGICLTDSPILAERMRVLRDHGMRPERRYWHEEVGYNYRMTNMQAAIGCAQLEQIDKILEIRKSIQALYAEEMVNIPCVRMPPVLPTAYSAVTWFACATVPAQHRQALIEACRSVNVDLRPFFHGLSVMPAYKRWARPCPTSKRLSQEGVNLPTSHLIDRATVVRIADAFRKILV